VFLQCFDTVGCVIWPVKIRPRYDLWCVWWDVKPSSINQSIKQPSSHCRIVNMEGHHILLEFSFFWNAVLAGRHIKLDQTLSRVRKWSSKSWGYTLPIKQGSPKLHIFWLFYDDVGLKRPHFYMKLATDKRKYHFKPQGTLHSSKKFSGPQTAADFVTILRLKRKCLCNETSANNWKKIFKLLRVITYMRQNLMSFGPQMAEI